MKLPLSPVTKGMLVSAAGGMILLAGSGIPLSSIDAQQKSDIQQELEKLYNQDGRSAPDMRVRSLPRETIDGRVFHESADPSGLPVSSKPEANGLKYDPSLLSTNQIQAPAQPQRKKSLLDRLMFWKKDKPVPRQVRQPAPQTQQAPQPRQSSTTPARPASSRRTPARESAVAPLAPPADLRYQRPNAQRPRPYSSATQAETSRQPVTLELPTNDSPQKRKPPLPGSIRDPQPLRQPVVQPQPARQPIIGAQPDPGTLPVITPKAPPAPAAPDAPNRVIVTPGNSLNSTEKAASLPLAPPEESPFDEPAPLRGPRPMPAEDAADPAFADRPDADEKVPAAVVDEPQDQDDPLPAAKLPNLDELPETPLPIVPDEEKPLAEQPPMGEENFPDPFTDVSETEADSDKTDMTIPDIQMNDTPAADVPSDDTAEPEESALPQRPAVPADEPAEDDAKPPVAEDENPFSGLKLDETDAPVPALEADPEAAPTLPLDAPEEDSNEDVEAPAGAPSLPDLDPAFDDDFKLPVKKETSEEPMPEHPILEKIPESPLPELPAADEGDISWEEDQARREAKLALIAAREGETGMKGFCIVELRDRRDLVDAVPAFRSTYNLRTYHFSSLEAKIEFDKAPRKYVPAYDGNDPILLSTQSEEREGSLDYALWFKGRLYLFTSQENLEVFQADPVLYSEN